jgi:transposase
MHGVTCNRLFGWCRPTASGAQNDTRASSEVPPAREYRALKNQMRKLHRTVGKKTMENEILR